jgi:hypothetical protein
MLRWRFDRFIYVAFYIERAARPGAVSPKPQISLNLPPAEYDERAKFEWASMSKQVKGTGSFT